MNEGLTEKVLVLLWLTPRTCQHAARPCLACLIWMTHVLSPVSPIYFTLFTLAYLFSLSDNRKDGILIAIVFVFLCSLPRVPCTLWASGNSGTLTGSSFLLMTRICSSSLILSHYLKGRHVV